MKYFYTYKLPFVSSKKTKFHYWKCKDSDECLERAVSKYKTTEFYIGEITEEAYCNAKGIPIQPKSSPEVTELLKSLYSIEAWMVNYVTPTTTGFEVERKELNKILRKYKNVPVSFEKLD